MQWISLIHHKFYVASMCFTVITCDALPVDNHGYYTNANCTSREQAYDDTCTLECHLGYIPNGDPEKTCQLDGTWNSSTRCIGKCHLDGTWNSSTGVLVSVTWMEHGIRQRDVLVSVTWVEHGTPQRGVLVSVTHRVDEFHVPSR